MPGPELVLTAAGADYRSGGQPAAIALAVRCRRRAEFACADLCRGCQASHRSALRGLGRGGCLPFAQARCRWGCSPPPPQPTPCPQQSGQTPGLSTPTRPPAQPAPGPQATTKRSPRDPTPDDRDHSAPTRNTPNPTRHNQQHKPRRRAPKNGARKHADTTHRDCKLSPTLAHTSRPTLCDRRARSIGSEKSRQVRPMPAPSKGGSEKQS